MNSSVNHGNDRGPSPRKAERDGVNLGSYPEVRALVDEFAAQVAALWTSFTDGERTQEEAMGGLKALADAYAAIWKGEREGFSLPPGRTPPVLAGKIAAWVPGIGGKGDVIGRYFLWLGRQILKGCQDVTDGMALEQAGPELAWVLGDAAEKLSGVQP